MRILWLMPMGCLAALLFLAAPRSGVALEKTLEGADWRLLEVSHIETRNQDPAPTDEGEAMVEGEGEGEASGEGEGEGEKEGEKEGEEEGEEEGEVEGEKEGEGEPVEEGEPETGTLVGVEIIAPLGNIVTTSDAAAATAMLVAKVSAANGLLDPSKVTVLFQIDADRSLAAWYEEGYFLLPVTFPISEPETVYTLQATAYGRDLKDYVRSEAVEFSVLTGDDLEQDGFADDPFTALPIAGDLWLSTGRTLGCPRATAMAAMAPGIEAAPVFLPNPEYPEQYVMVHASSALVETAEQGVLIAAMSCSAEDLFHPYDVSAVRPTEPGALAINGMYVEVSLIVSQNGGVSFSEASPRRFAAHPVRLSMNKISRRDGYEPQFHGYPILVDSDIVHGVRVIPLSGEWTLEGLENKGQAARGGAYVVELKRPVVTAPFELSHPAELQIEPSPDETYNYGVIEANHPETAAFTLTNIGGETLLCDITFENPQGVFFVQGEKRLLLDPAESHVLKVQFIPGAAQEYDARLVFRGGVNSPQVLELVGRGSSGGKRIRPLGCGRGDGMGLRFSRADLLAALTAAGLIGLRSRRMLRGRKSENDS